MITLETLGALATYRKVKGKGMKGRRKRGREKEERKTKRKEKRKVEKNKERKAERMGEKDVEDMRKIERDRGGRKIDRRNGREREEEG